MRPDKNEINFLDSSRVYLELFFSFLEKEQFKYSLRSEVSMEF